MNFPHLRRIFSGCMSKAERAGFWWQTSCQWSPLAGPSNPLFPHLYKLISNKAPAMCWPSQTSTGKCRVSILSGESLTELAQTSAHTNRSQHKEQNMGNEAKKCLALCHASLVLIAGLWNNGLEARKETDRNLKHLQASKVCRCPTVNLHDQKLI